jgi:chromosomal replication initiation ATPase DnaA
MVKSLHNKIKLAEEQYYRLVLLVGKSGSGKTDVLRNLAMDLKTSVINVNLALSREFLELTAKQRQHQFSEIFDKIVGKVPTPVLLDNIEILLNKDFEQDPLRLLQSISRNRVVVASWNGTINSEKILYAEINHREYLEYNLDGFLFVCMGGGKHD